ncbi:MAG: FAD-dependent thymidylate synthase [Firmicutes bacterium]|nr:FAD-dependent thymidylate synthase [Bacillota bacterium]
MKVELLNYTPDPERTVAAAARLCYSKTGAADLLEELTDEKVARLITHLLNSGHESPLEHVSFTFTIEGVSRALSHQLVRHRIASYSQQSQRYVKEDSFTYIVPPSIDSCPAAKKAFLQTMVAIQKAYNKLVEQVPAEDARYVLPNACETKLVATFNCRSLHNFFRLRCCHRAQWEIRRLAEEMRKLVLQVAPLLFSSAGPSCETEGVCYEGRFSCGRAKFVSNRDGVSNVRLKRADKLNP